MKLKQTIVLLIVCASVFGLFLTAVNSDFAQAADCGDFQTSILPCGEDPSRGGGVEGTGLWGLLILVINILTAGIGIVAVGGIIYGAVLYTTSGGSLDQVKKARQIIRDVIIGLAMYAIMYAFLNYIVPGGMFN